jgi:hypothetical protein
VTESRRVLRSLAVSRVAEAVAEAEEQRLGYHGPTYSSRRRRAERSTSIEIRVTTAERNALVDVGRVGEFS